MNKLIVFVSIVLISLLPKTGKGQNSGPPPAVAPGLQISRSELFGQFKEYKLPYTFTEATDEDGFPCYVSSTESETVVKIIGKPNLLKKAEFTLNLKNGAETHMEGLTNGAKFVFAFGSQAAVDWFQEQIIKVSNSKATSFKETKNFDYNRKITFQYVPNKRLLALTVTEWLSN